MLRRMSLLALFALTAACATTPPGSDPPGGPEAARSLPSPTARLQRYEIKYTIAMPNPASHLYEIRIDIRGVRDDTVKLQLPVWSPGRYGRMDFARNVQDFRATSADGRALPWDKQNGSLWRVQPRGAVNITVRYRVFANTLSGTFSVLDTLHANWNGPSLFMYVDEHKPDPVTLRVVPPSGWHVINGESRALDQLDFSFPNYDVLVDTPTEVAPGIGVDSFRVDGILYRAMIHNNAPEVGQRARFMRDLERIVRYENTVIAPPPIERYTFLFNIAFQGGDGMEHLNSTQIMHPSPWGATDTVIPGIEIAAHEYFHTWNMKRVRAATLGPFDYTVEQYQPTLWVGEGWTNYYGDIALARTGIIDRNEYYGILAGVARYNNEMPGRKEVSPRMSSFHAPYWDGREAPMATNGVNSWVSYYVIGEGRAAFLDLYIRGRTNGAKSLDDVLRLLKQRTWDAPSNSYYLQGRGYTETDVERAVSEVAGVDMKPWFDRYIGGTDDLPWQQALDVVGLRLTLTPAAQGMPAYAVTEMPNATPEQKRLRAAWLGEAGR